MLFLCFEVEQDVYGLPAQVIRQVLPLVNFKRLPGAPAAVSGLMNFRQQMVPVIDVHYMLAGSRCAECLSSRILVVECAAARASEGLLGLLVERATRTVKLDPQDFQPAPVRTEGSPFLGPVAQVEGRFLQRVEVNALLTPEIQQALDQVKEMEVA